MTLLSLLYRSELRSGCGNASTRSQGMLVCGALRRDELSGRPLL